MSSLIFSGIMYGYSLNKAMFILGTIGTILIAWAIAGFIFTFLIGYQLLLVPQWLCYLPIPLFINSNVNLGIAAIGICFWGAAFAVRPQTIRIGLDEDV
jgi:hypothetical protein